MRNSAAQFIHDFCKANKEGFLISGDAGFGVWENFRAELPSQYINPGINEQATIGFAAGMSLCGHTVFLYNIIPFVLYRCYEQVRNDICYQDLPVILIGIGGGITYAPAGMTHYALEDIALAKTMPNLDIFSPSDPLQVKKALEFAIKSKKPTYIRVSKSGEPNITPKDSEIDKPIYLREEKGVGLLFHGSISDDVLKASKILDNRGISHSVISCPFLTPTSKSEYQAIFTKHSKIFVVEEHFEDGGFGSLLQNLGFSAIRIAIKNHYIHDIGDRDYLRNLFAISGEKIAERVLKEIQ